jgi:hypothetical protein
MAGQRFAIWQLRELHLTIPEEVIAYESQKTSIPDLSARTSPFVLSGDHDQHYDVGRSFADPNLTWRNKRSATAQNMGCATTGEIQGGSLEMELFSFCPEKHCRIF